MARDGSSSKKKRRKTKAAAITLTIIFLWYTYTVVSASLAILCAIVIISSIIAFLVLRRRRRRRADRVLFEMGVRDINVMDGIAFERFLEALFRRLGYVSEATQASGDYGVDVLLRRKKRRIAVQAKHYSAPVGLSAVQEAHAGMSFYGADEAWVITNNTFTKSAVELSRKTGVRLIDGAKLHEMIASASGTKYEKTRPRGDAPPAARDDDPPPAPEGQAA